MDPDKALEDLRRLVSELGDEVGEESSSLWSTATQLSETFEALDAWIERGGFLPKAWQASGDAAALAEVRRLFKIVEHEDNQSAHNTPVEDELMRGIEALLKGG